MGQLGHICESPLLGKRKQLRPKARPGPGNITQARANIIDASSSDDNNRDLTNTVEGNEHLTFEFVFIPSYLCAFLNPLLPDPFNITYPTAVQASLPSQCSLARFDRSGRFVAAGRSDGSAAVWDLETREAVRWLEGHVKGITSVECVTSHV